MSLFPSSLIISSSPQKSQEKVISLLSEFHHQLTNDPDLFILDDYSIASVRLIKKFLSQKAFNHQEKFVYIPDAHQLHHESQNALLKILEEPGKDNYVLLTTTNPQKLLPTILSRCQKIKLQSDSPKSENKLWPLTGNVKKDLLFASTLTTDKNEIKNLLLDQLQIRQEQYISSPNSDNAKIIKKLIAALDLIENNVDPKSALDYFFLA